MWSGYKRQWKEFGFLFIRTTNTDFTTHAQHKRAYTHINTN